MRKVLSKICDSILVFGIIVAIVGSLSAIAGFVTFFMTCCNHEFITAFIYSWAIFVSSILILIVLYFAACLVLMIEKKLSK